MTKLAIRAIMRTGLSFGIADEDIPKEARIQINEVLAEAEDAVQNLIKSYINKELDPLPGRTLDETIEMSIMQKLGKARDKTGGIADSHMGLENPAVIMARSGARGSILNLTQMAACVGQQAVRGERIRRGYAGRTLPHFLEGDLGSDAHGFVKASYKSGLNPTEYFFHAIGGREGLVDTAVRHHSQVTCREDLSMPFRTLRFSTTLQSGTPEVCLFSSSTGKMELTDKE
jgi:DNA-directed RNA polymerase subunit A'